MPKLRDLLDLEIDVDQWVAFAKAVRRFNTIEEMMSDLTDQMDALVGRYANIAAVLSADIAAVQATLSAKVTTSMSDADVAAVKSDLTKLSTTADMLQGLANGMTPPAAVTSTVTGDTSTATATPGAASQAASTIAPGTNTSGAAASAAAPASTTSAPAAAGAPAASGTAASPPAETAPSDVPGSAASTPPASGS